jgi:lipopolysaccharide export system permease protein
MGILLAFRNLALSSELDAMRSVGLGYGRLLRIPFAFAFVLIATNVGIVGYVQPHAEYAYQELEFELRSGALGASIQVGEFTPLGDDLTLRVEGSENGGRRSAACSCAWTTSRACRSPPPPTAASSSRPTMRT